MKKASLLWVDLEMTGLDPKEDAILEVAAIATDYDFKPIATYEGVVKVDEKELDRKKKCLISNIILYYDKTCQINDLIVNTLHY